MYYSKPPGYPNLDAIHDAAVLFVQKYQQQRQVVKKALRDGQYEEVEARRYECLCCGKTFRVYPQGVTWAQVSQVLGDSWL